MKSRLVVLTMLVFGMLLSTAGAGLAVSGLSDDASVSQYGPPKAPANDVLGDEDASGNDVLPDDSPGANNAPSDDSGVQPSRQSEAGASPSTGSSLPFTGFAALPILIGGIALLTAGLVVRRKSAGER